MNLKRWHGIGALGTLLLGTLLHFTYEWSGNNMFIGLFSAVNESTWEHLKLLAVPMLAFAAIEYFIYGRPYANFVPARLIAVLTGMLTITALFYTYTGVIGRQFPVVNILLFVLGTLAAWVINFRLLQSGRYSSMNARIFGVLGLFVLITAFVTFTLAPPELALFRDPSSGAYGL